MKVIQLIDTLEAGGAERMAVNLANILCAEVEASHICTTRLEGGLKASIIDEVGYLFLNKKNALDIKAFFKLRRYIKTRNVDVIHAHSSSFFLAVIIKWSLTRKVKVVWHDHYGNSEFVHERKPFVLKLFSKSFAHIIAVNKILENWSRTYLNHKKVSYIPNFATINSCEEVTYLKGESGKRIVCLANLRVQKDHINLLKSFKLISDKYPSWTLHLVGKNFNDSYYLDVKNEIKKQQLENKVFYYGSRQDITFILSQSTIGVLSSKSEGLPLALLEYGLSGLPIVVTDVGECKAVVGNDLEEFFVVKPNNNRELCNAVVKLIENNDLRQTVALVFKKKVEEHFSKSAIVSKLLNIYKLG